MKKDPSLPRAFADLGLEVPILRALAKINFIIPSDIQAAMIPHVLAGRDVLGQARTGTGKTAAFSLPILQMLDPRLGMQAMVLAPTRELAAQIVGEVRRFAEFLSIHCVPVYGGTGMKGQMQELGRKPHMIVGTPGRVMDMLGRGAFNFKSLRFAVLDEVDRMLDIGFREDIRRILTAIEAPHQTVFVSATLSDEIKSLARRYTNDPLEVNVSRDEVTVDEVKQFYCSAEPWDKFRLLQHVLYEEQPKLAIIFCNTKHAVRKLARRLHSVNIEAREIHGDLVQQKRETVMERFRKHQIPVLVATDLAARGIDVSAITHIINYDVPRDIEAYVHRIGRTARMGAFGKAITFVTKAEGKQLTDIEKLINKQILSWQVPGFIPSMPPDDYIVYVEDPLAGIVPNKPATPPAPAKPRSIGAKFPVSRRGGRRR